MQDIEQNFGDHPGTVNTDRLPTTAADAQKLWAWSKANCMTYFGPFEDAMSVHSRCFTPWCRAWSTTVGSRRCG